MPLDNISEKTIDYMELKAKYTVEALREKAANFLQALLEKKNRVDEDKVRLHALIIAYNAKKSRFTQWSEWYGTLAWYEEVGYVTAFIAASALVGFAFNFAALFTLISIGICYLARSLFIEHNEIASSQNDALLESVTIMIDNLVASIEQLSLLAQELNAMQVKLSEQCIEMDAEIQAFKEQIARMAREMDALKDETHALVQARNTLIQENERINQQRDISNIETCKANAIIMELSSQLSDIQQKSDITHQTFLTRNEELTALHANMQANTIALSGVRKDYEHELAFFKSHSKGNQSTPNIDQQLLDSDAVLRQAEMFIG